MFSLLECVFDPPVFRFTYSTLGLDDNEWHHIMAVVPLAGWVDEILIPLAKERGDALQVQDVVRALYRNTEANRIPFDGLDWLGLSLLTSQRSREALAQLSDATSVEIQEECRARHRLEKICHELYQQLSPFHNALLCSWLTSAA